LSLAAVALVALAAYTGFWFYMAGQLRAELEPFVKTRTDEGYTIRWDRVAVHGFPAFFRYDFTNLTFGTRRPLPVLLEAAAASLSTLPGDFKHWRFATPSGARLVEASGVAGFEAANLDGVIDVGNTATTFIDVSALNLDGTGIARGFRIGNAEGHLEVPN